MNKKSPSKKYKNLEERQIFYQIMFVVRKKKYVKKDVFDISQETYISFLKIFFLRYLHCLYLFFVCSNKSINNIHII